MRAIALTTILVFLMGMSSAAVSVHGTGGLGDDHTVPWVVVMALGGLFAAAYVPLRWRRLRALGPVWGALALVGGAGLMVWTVALAVLVMRA